MEYILYFKFHILSLKLCNFTIFTIEWEVLRGIKNNRMKIFNGITLNIVILTYERYIENIYYPNIAT